MLEYDRIDASERIVVNKTSGPKEWDICHYLHFLNKRFKFEPYVCNNCNDLVQKVFLIVSNKGNDCRIHFWHINKEMP